jgi:hypothetical protein
MDGNYPSTDPRVRLREFAEVLGKAKAEHLTPELILTALTSLTGLTLEFVHDPNNLGGSVPNETMRFAFLQVGKLVRERGPLLHEWSGTETLTTEQRIICSINTQIMFLTILVTGILARTGIARDLGFTDEEIATYESLVQQGTDE